MLTRYFEDVSPGLLLCIPSEGPPPLAHSHWLGHQDTISFCGDLGRDMLTLCWCFLIVRDADADHVD